VDEEDINKIIKILECLIIILQKYGFMLNNFDNELISSFKIFNDSENLHFRTKLAYCLYEYLKIKKELIFEHSEFLMSFFFHNYKLENYELNFLNSEFFLLIIEIYENNNELNSTNNSEFIIKSYNSSNIIKENYFSFDKDTKSNFLNNFEDYLKK